MLQTQSRKVLLANLVDLPLEVLVEILSLVEWKDILRIRQVRLCLCNSNAPLDLM